jgi:hypothetical protein
MATGPRPSLPGTGTCPVDRVPLRGCSDAAVAAPGAPGQEVALVPDLCGAAQAPHDLPGHEGANEPVVLRDGGTADALVKPLLGVR